LGARARSELATSPFTASVVNLWELVLKSRKPGALVEDPVPWWDEFVVRNSISVLPVRTAHVRALAALPDIHRDPFDRMLIAQAIAEKLTLATRDGVFAQYGAPIVWD
jgi:PIN domain nuclease of toxin-antitoxin system